MTRRVDIDKIAHGLGLGARRRGAQVVKSGYFGAMQLVDDVKKRLKTPKGGGHATDPAWTQRRIVPLTEQTLNRLEKFALRVGDITNVRIEPMQLAAVILERTLEGMTDQDAQKLMQR
jgi:hypothetical protein